MSKQRYRYYIEGYLYAPESYRVFKRLLANGTEREINLTDSEQSTMSLYCFSKGFDQAVDYVKQLERRRLRKPKEYVTYGFWTLEEPDSYIYSTAFRCQTSVPIKEKLLCKKAFEEELRRNNGKVELYTECRLGANFRPEKVQKHCLTADFSRPLAIRFTI
ncbi:MAG: hypothetical protein NC203_10955 [Firmicutes bacterium]|nr:hypothetical protein [Bacillota bacterium]